MVLTQTNFCVSDFAQEPTVIGRRQSDLPLEVSTLASSITTTTNISSDSPLV